MLRALVTLGWLLVVIPGCPRPGSRTYTPQAGWLRDLNDKARRDLLPDDVRRDPAAHDKELVVWTGIVRSQSISHEDGRDVAVTSIEHHYWDFHEDFGVQRAHAFLSPRGEGIFLIRTWAASQDADAKCLTLGWMVIVWGNVAKLGPDGSVRLNLRGLSCIAPGLFSTEMWDYGRPYLLQHDRSDLHVLRVF